MVTEKTIDMHTHCMIKPDLKAEFLWFDGTYEKKIQQHINYLKKNKIDKALVHILDERAIAIDCRSYTNLTMTLCIDFRKPSAVNLVKKAKLSGFKGIKILTYEQCVEKKDYVHILKMAKEIEKQKMFLTICATFGGENPYKHDALAMTRYLLQNGYKSFLILAHAGGSRVKEAVLIADAAPNIYFDTSFTTTYWRGSAVMKDLALAINKFPGRFFFGSDSPNVSFVQAKKDSLEMLGEISERLRNDFFYNNAFNFLKKYEKQNFSGRRSS